jgi:uncharacterized protein (TIGR03437 family)
MPRSLLAAIAVLALIAGVSGVVLRSRRLRPGPELTARNVVNAANLKAGGIAPGEIVVLFPSNAGPPHIAEWPTIFPRSAADLEYIWRQPGWASIGATRVFFDGVAAPIVYSVRGQVETVVPWEVSNRKTTGVAVEYEGARSRSVTLPVVAGAPALFTLDASGSGQAAMLNETGCCNSARNPATRGTIASLYATGEGSPPLHVKVLVGGVPALAGAGYEVFTARDAQQARAPSKDHPVDLIITDSATAEQAGLEMIDTIRNEHPRVKIIVISAEADARVLKAADILGAQAVLRKPLKAEIVVERVRDLLRERPARY